MSSMRASIRNSLLRWILVGMLGVLALSLAVAAIVARRTAHKAYDQALYAMAVDISSTVHVENEGVALVMSAQSADFVRTDEVDRLYFCVRDGNGEVVGGEKDLPFLPLSSDHTSSSRAASFRAEHAVQVMTVPFRRGNADFTVTVAETMNKRSALFETIITSLLVPMVLLLGIAYGAIWLAVRKGLQPLTVLEREIAARNAHDLTPIADSHIPKEAASLGLALNRLLQQLREASESQRRFVADAAHQLRTPLAGIQAETELLRQTPLPTALPIHVVRLSQAVHRMVRLTSQLLTLARSEPGVNSHRPWQVIDLTSVAQRGADEWYHQALARQIDLGFDLMPALVTGDSDALGELLANLVDNALNYTPAGGEVTVETGCDARGAFLRVVDSGPGVRLAEQEQIFERFHRGSASIAAQGVGLGLAIVREIAEAHHAHVIYCDAPRGGACFELRFFARPFP